MWRIIFILFLDIFVSSIAYAQQANVPCFGAEDCVQILRKNKPKIYSNEFKLVKEYFVQRPKEAQQALIPILTDDNEDIVKLAIDILGDMKAIDPVYTSHLVEAHKSGKYGLRELIASTQSQEALDYLWMNFQEDPDQDVSPFDAFGNRMDALIKDAKKSCTQKNRLLLCFGIAEMMETIQGDPKAAEDFVVFLATDDAVPFNLRLEAQFDLMSDDHALSETFYENAIIWLLADFRGPRDWADFYNRHEWVYDNDLSYLVEVMVDNEFEPQQLGHIVTPLLAYPELKKTRRAVAHAILETEYLPGAKALLDYQDTFEDDWILAHYAIEAFGKLRIKEAEPILSYYRDNHWYNPVRRQAKRAMNALKGGKFEIEADRVNEETERRKRKMLLEDDEIIVSSYHGPRTPAKEHDIFAPCETSNTLPYAAGMYLPPTPKELDEIIALKEFSVIGIYEFNNILLDAIGGVEANDPNFLLDINGQMILSDGMDRETGKKGGLYLYDKQDLSTKLLEGNYKFAFQTPNSRVLISDEIQLDAVHIYTVEDEDLILKREIFLPHDWNGSFYGPDNSLIFSTRGGDLGIDEDGNPFDPVIEGYCAGPIEVD